MQRLSLNIHLAIEQVILHRLRSLLTALGIVFGVGAVITMLAVGAGAKQAILDQMKLIGANNILIKAQLLDNPANEDQTNKSKQDQDRRPLSKGLDLADVAAIKAIVPQVETISPEVEVNVNLIRAGRMEKGKVVGVSNDYFDLNKLSVKHGQLFHHLHEQADMPVCIIGAGINRRFFQHASALGQRIKCGQEWLTVIGVLNERPLAAEIQARLGIRDNSFEVYVPIHTALLRFENRARFAQQHRRKPGTSGPHAMNYHQLDRLTVRVSESDKLRATADLLQKLLYRRHQQLADFEIVVPELLLEQEQRTQQTFNLVLAAIASISLLVGGIGIMNIMLASVLERIPEIGLRRSLGAKQSDIQQQFIFEAIFICLIGGLLGVLLGVGGAKIITRSADIPTMVTGWSVALSFFVASLVGLVFGIIPAQQAAQQDPVTALRSGI